jgi:hypothetical protein
MKVVKVKKVGINALKDLVGTDKYDMVLDQLRKPRLECFDIVLLQHLANIHPLSPSEFQELLSWRIAICNKNINAFVNMPERVRYHFERTYKE